jgi:DNA recombination protein RmuC
MALLKVIAYGWRQNRMSENALAVRKLGEDLHKRLATFVSHLQKVSRSLGSAVDSFNASVGSMERNVLPQARKFAELGVTNEQLESVDPIEALVRLPAGESNTDETQN